MGTTTVTCTVTDGAGITISSDFRVTVVDTTPPSIVAPGAITVPKQKGVKQKHVGGAIVSFSVSASDIVDGTISPITSVASGNFFPIGTTNVDVSAVDAHGNQSTASFTVTVTKPQRRGR